jgi:hypothetical protein
MFILIMLNDNIKKNDIRFDKFSIFFIIKLDFVPISKDSCIELTKAIDVNPSVAKYYVSRSRVKYLTEDIQGAQQDIIAAILINPLEDGCIDVLPRLFTDSTLAQVLSSLLTKKVKENLLKRGVRLAIA